MSTNKITRIISFINDMIIKCNKLIKLPIANEIGLSDDLIILKRDLKICLMKLNTLGGKINLSQEQDIISALDDSLDRMSDALMQKTGPHITDEQRKKLKDKSAKNFIDEISELTMSTTIPSSPADNQKILIDINKYYIDLIYKIRHAERHLDMEGRNFIATLEQNINKLNSLRVMTPAKIKMKFEKISKELDEYLKEKLQSENRSSGDPNQALNNTLQFDRGDSKTNRDNVSPVKNISSDNSKKNTPKSKL